MFMRKINNYNYAVIEKHYSPEHGEDRYFWISVPKTTDLIGLKTTLVEEASNPSDFLDKTLEL